MKHQEIIKTNIFSFKGSSLEVKDVEKTANRNSEVASTNASSGYFTLLYSRFN